MDALDEVVAGDEPQAMDTRGTTATGIRVTLLITLDI
jgi:hypothetical protein